MPHVSANGLPGCVSTSAPFTAAKDLETLLSLLLRVRSSFVRRSDAARLFLSVVYQHVPKLRSHRQTDGSLTFRPFASVHLLKHYQPSARRRASCMT